MKKQVKYISAGMLAGMLLCGGQMQAANTMSGMHVCVTDARKTIVRKFPNVFSVRMR